MSAAQFLIRNLNEFQKHLEQDRLAVVKAAQTAAKIEGYRLMGVLKQEIKAGAPGGMPFSPLTEMARLSGKKKSRRPLERLAQPVRYRAGEQGGSYSVKVGYLVEDIADPSIKSASRISKSWARLVQASQEGEQIPVTPELRRRMRTIGSGLKGKWSKAGRSGGRVMGGNPAAKYFFLRSSTGVLRVPPRPIISPFWSRYQGQALGNIQRNFEAKMRGERI